MQWSGKRRVWMGLLVALAVVAIGWGGLLLEVLGSGGPAPVLPAVLVTGVLVALTVGLVVALDRCRSMRDVVVVYVIYALTVLGGGVLCAP